MSSSNSFEALWIFILFFRLLSLFTGVYQCWRWWWWWCRRRRWQKWCTWSAMTTTMMMMMAHSCMSASVGIDAPAAVLLEAQCGNSILISLILSKRFSKRQSENTAKTLSWIMLTTVELTPAGSIIVITIIFLYYSFTTVQRFAAMQRIESRTVFMN